MPAYRSTCRYSAAIIAGSQHTLAQLPRWAKDKSIFIPENGVDLERFSFPRDRVSTLPLRAVFVGRLVPYKGADILIKAAAEFLKRGQLELHIIGDGVQRDLLERLVDRLSIRDSVRFYGDIPHTQIQHHLRTCDFMAFPSIRELGGAVVIEAMALGVTPVVADYAGPADLVDENTGIRIPFRDEKSLIDGMRRAIGEIIDHPEVLERLGAAARQRVLADLTWDAKARQILSVYRTALAAVPAR
jgi:glycosyltransferase involved in cell wall biosynthesis